MKEQLTKAQCEDIWQWSAGIEQQVKLGDTQHTCPLLNATSKLTTKS